MLTFLKQPLSPLLPVILPYTTGTAARIPEIEARPEIPHPSDPLPKDTPLPISHALEYLADCLVEQRQIAEAKEVFEELRQRYDRIRAGYWSFRKDQCGS